MGPQSQTAAPRLRSRSPGRACLLPAEAGGHGAGPLCLLPPASSPSLGQALPRAPEVGDPGPVSAKAPGQGHSIEAGLFPTREGGDSGGLLHTSHSHRGQVSSDFQGVTHTRRFSLLRDHRSAPLKEWITTPLPHLPILDLDRPGGEGAGVSQASLRSGSRPAHSGLFSPRPPPFTSSRCPPGPARRPQGQLRLRGREPVLFRVEIQNLS